MSLKRVCFFGLEIASVSLRATPTIKLSQTRRVSKTHRVFFGSERGLRSKRAPRYAEKLILNLLNQFFELRASNRNMIGIVQYYFSTIATTNTFDIIKIDKEGFVWPKEAILWQ